VTVNLSAGTAAGGDAEGDTFANFENVNGGSGNDSLTGDNDANALSGGAGNDKFVGRGGDDDIDGGRGKDRVDYSASASDVVVNLKKRVGAGITEGTDTLSRLENIKGTLFNDTLVGNDAANLIIAGDGNDIIKALRGNDKLKGGAGNDRINGGPGRDRCKGGPGKDKIVKCER
jgi:Ca2+-binding RTX toxin-like protein